MRFDWDKILQKKTVVNCKTEVQAEIITKEADKKKLIWACGDRYINNHGWDNETDCYNFLTGEYNSLEYWTDNKCKILSYQDVLLKNDVDDIKELLKDMLNKSDKKYNYITVDRNGEINLHISIPILGSIFWDSESYFFHGNIHKHIDCDIAKIWKDLLISRDEIICTENTSKKYDNGKLRYHLVPPFAIEELCKVLNYGFVKYGENTWQGIDEPEKRYYSALMRHLQEYRKGNKIDDESGLSHLSHAMTNIMFLLHFEKDNNK